MSTFRRVIVYATLLGAYLFMFAVAFFWGTHGSLVRFLSALSAAWFTMLAFVVVVIMQRVERRFDRLEETIRECMKPSLPRGETSSKQTETQT